MIFSVSSGLLLAESSLHESPIAAVLLAIIVIIIAARIGGSVFESWGQPAVLGELVVGVLLGNLTLLGITNLEFLRVSWTHQTILDLSDAKHCAGVAVDAFARLGVLLLMFQAGLENSITRMRRVGLTALSVAVLGVVAPFTLSWGCAWLLLPEGGWKLHVFIAAALCATSVGITARVFADLNLSSSSESQIVLGAAVIDDVLGLIVLSVVQGMILATGSTGAEFGAQDMIMIMVQAGGFLSFAILVGPWFSRRIFRAASVLHGRGLLLCTALAICFGFAWMAGYAGLAPLVGAFAAGLVLESAQYSELSARNDQPLHELLRPIADFIVPVFFVMTGFRVDLASFANLGVIGLAVILTGIAVLGKLACALGVSMPGTNRIAIGFGMIPRGEVGLIFASIGLALNVNGLPLFNSSVYSALVATMMLTTLAAPPLLKWSLQQSQPIDPADLTHSDP